jgi:hypothetical protein
MYRNTRQFRIIHSCPAQLRRGQIEAERFDQMQFCAGICAKPNDIARVRRYLGGHENNMEHLRTPPKMMIYEKSAD